MSTLNRTGQLHFWVTEAEHDQLRVTAEAFALSVNQYSRYVLHLALERHRHAIKGKSAEEVATIGNLIRQRVAEHDKELEQACQKRARKRRLA
jgi:hypothetical protein